MPSTHLSLDCHLVFSTKNRPPLIGKQWQGRLHALLGGAVKAGDGIPEQVGGVEDQVHMLIGLRATHCLADVVRDIKSASSLRVSETLGKRLFSRQEGQAGFTLSPSQAARVKKYIERHKEHHRKISFKEEYLELHKRSGVEFDEPFLW